jgi:serine/threonine protein kinase
MAFADEGDRMHTALSTLGKSGHPWTHEELGNALKAFHASGLQLLNDVLGPGAHALALREALRDNKAVLCGFSEEIAAITRRVQIGSYPKPIETKLGATGRDQATSIDVQFRQHAKKVQQGISAILTVTREIASAIEDREDLVTATALPDAIGPWSVVRQLGDGGQATAYLVIRRDDATQTKRVLKVLKPWSPQSKATSEAAQRSRFSREVKALKDLGTEACPDIVSVLDDDLSPASGQPWYAMPFYAGPLSKRFDEFQGNIDRVLIVAETIASTLAWMHEHEPVHVHRDVHAGNIFFELKGDRAKLGDFGLVHVDEEREAGQLVTTPIEEFGPWQWRPPELHKGSRNRHDPLSDVYLLGGLIYGALTGGEYIEETEHGRGFAHETPELSIARFSSDPRVPHVNALLRYMLARDPSARQKAGNVARLCVEIRMWRPGTSAPVAITPRDEVQAAATRWRARSGANRRNMRMQELSEVCSRVQARFRLSPRPDEVQQSVSLDVKAYPRQLNDGSVLSLRVILQLRVGFESEPRIVLDSYVELGSTADMKMMIAVQEHNASDFELVDSFLESDPDLENRVYRVVQAQFDDLNRRLAAILDSAP